MTLVIQGLAFFAVAWLVMKFGWPHIMAAIEERQKKIAEGLAAGRARPEGARRSEELGERHHQARRTPAPARSWTRRTAVPPSWSTRRAAPRSPKASAWSAKRARKSSWRPTRAREELRKEVATLAVIGASRLLGREIDAKAHAELLDKLALEIERG